MVGAHICLACPYAFDDNGEYIEDSDCVSTAESICIYLKEEKDRIDRENITLHDPINDPYGKMKGNVKELEPERKIKKQSFISVETLKEIEILVDSSKDGISGTEIRALYNITTNLFYSLRRRKIFVTKRIGNDAKLIKVNPELEEDNEVRKRLEAKGVDVR